MASRYQNTIFYRNTNPLYSSVFRERGVPYINQYTTTQFQGGALPGITSERVRWQPGDRLDKLSGFYYGNSTYWWVIARYNQKPTDAHFKVGDLVFIPMPLEAALERYLG